MEIISCEKLSFTYALSDKPALRNVNFSINDGEFCLVIGKSAAGKSTLLKLLKKEIAPAGKMDGTVKRCDGIGYVSQNAEEMIVCDKVRTELSFGLTNLGYPAQKIELKVSEIAGYFNLESKLDNDISSLSGGEKQILNLASIMIMKPHVLVLDEPTCQLDPVWADRFANIIKKLNRDFGTTVIIAEHLLDEFYSYADSVLLIENSTVEAKLPPREMTEYLKNTNNDLLKSIPLQYRISDAYGDISLCRSILKKLSLSDIYDKDEKCDIALKIRNLIFGYDKRNDVINDLCLDVYKNKINVIVGANSSGKSTLLKLISGVLKQRHGKIKTDLKASMMCQNPCDLFIHDKCCDEVEFGTITEFLEIDDIKNKHPYDISGGQAQRLALAMVLNTGADLILLDEPTKALDTAFKQKLGEKLKELCKMGKTILIVTHDTDFAGEFGDSISFLSKGKIVTTKSRRDFFNSLDFFTTSVSKLTNGIAKGYVCESDLEGRL